MTESHLERFARPDLLLLCLFDLNGRFAEILDRLSYRKKEHVIRRVRWVTTYTFVGFQIGRRDSQDQLIGRRPLQCLSNRIGFTDGLVQSMPFFLQSIEEGLLCFRPIKRRSIHYCFCLCLFLTRGEATEINASEYWIVSHENGFWPAGVGDTRSLRLKISFASRLDLHRAINHTVTCRIHRPLHLLHCGRNEGTYHSLLISYRYSFLT